MGYSLRGCNESDMTKATLHARRSYPTNLKLGAEGLGRCPRLQHHFREGAAGRLLQASPGLLENQAGFASVARVSRTQRCPAVPQPAVSRAAARGGVFHLYLIKSSNAAVCESRVTHKNGYQINVYGCVCLSIYTRVHRFIGIFRPTTVINLIQSLQPGLIY